MDNSRLIICEIYCKYSLVKTLLLLKKNWQTTDLSSKFDTSMLVQLLLLKSKLEGKATYMGTHQGTFCFLM